MVQDSPDEPTRRLRQSVALLDKLLHAAAQHPDADGARPDVPVDEIGAALGLVETLRHQVDRWETQLVMEGRRRGMDWKAIAAYQGFNSAQAASQRYQRLMTRLEEIRQGVR